MKYYVQRGLNEYGPYTLADLQNHKTEQAIRAAGKLRLEGKEYVMHDGDITHFQAGLAGRK